MCPEIYYINDVSGLLEFELIVKEGGFEDDEKAEGDALELAILGD